jgi:ACS family allantoate permease-like MFS transporter
VSFGFTPDESLLYGTVGGVVELLFLPAAAWLGDRYKNRILIALSGTFTSMLGMLLIVCLPFSHRVGRLAGYYLTQASPTTFVAILSLLSTNVAGYTKKTTVAAMLLIGYCIGNIIGPQIFRPKDAPKYRPAQITILICYGVTVCDMLFIYWYYNRCNRKNDAIRAEPGYRTVERQEFLDLTDRENGEFVYVL